jgi:hypothetical protein
MTQRSLSGARAVGVWERRRLTQPGRTVAPDEREVRWPGDRVPALLLVLWTSGAGSSPLVSSKSTVGAAPAACPEQEPAGGARAGASVAEAASSPAWRMLCARPLDVSRPTDAREPLVSSLPPSVASMMCGSRSRSPHANWTARRPGNCDSELCSPVRRARPGSPYLWGLVAPASSVEPELRAWRRTVCAAAFASTPSSTSWAAGPMQGDALALAGVGCSTPSHRAWKERR